MTTARAGKGKGLIWLGLATLVAIAIFISLGNWQVRRLAYKTRLAAEVASRLKEPPVPLPPPAIWREMDPETADYTPVTLTGHFDLSREFAVFATLAEPKGREGGSAGGFSRLSSRRTEPGSSSIAALCRIA